MTNNYKHVVRIKTISRPTFYVLKSRVVSNRCIKVAERDGEQEGSGLYIKNSRGALNG